MTSKRVQALILAAAVAGGYAGAAAYSAWAQPSVAIASDFGPGDGLTRYVLTAASGDAAALLPALTATDGVVNAQRLSDGHALVATEGLPPQALEALPGVADAEFSPSVPVLGTVTDPYVPQYGYNLDNTGTNSYNAPRVADADVDAPEGWAGGTGNGRIVAVVDTGYDSDHPELAGALWTNPAESCGAADTDGNGKAGDCHGWNFTTNSADVDNGSYGTHGTSVAGVIGGRAGNGLGTAGVAPDVTIMPLVVGSGSSVDVTLCAEAIRYAVDHGADVINASWGGSFSGWALDDLRSAIAYAAAHDVLVVAAAGNDAADRDTAAAVPRQPDRRERRDGRQLHRRRHDQLELGLRRGVRGPLRPRRPGPHHLERRRFPPGVRHVDRRPAGGGRLRALPGCVAGCHGRRAEAGAAGRRRSGGRVRREVRHRRAAVDRLAGRGRPRRGALHVRVDDRPGRRRTARYHRVRRRRDRRLLGRDRSRHGAGERGVGRLGQGADPRRHHPDDRRLRRGAVRPRDGRLAVRPRPVAVRAARGRPVRAHRPAVPRRDGPRPDVRRSPAGRHRGHRAERLRRPGFRHERRRDTGHGVRQQRLGLRRCGRHTRHGYPAAPAAAIRAPAPAPARGLGHGRLGHGRLRRRQLAQPG